MAAPKPRGAVRVRPAVVADARAIMTLVNELAVQQVMLPRSPASVIENIRDFVIAEIEGEFAGCGALAITWTDIGEVRSLAVRPGLQQRGIGRTLVQALIADARRLGLPRLFAFTYVPAFFARLGFEQSRHESLPHKVFNDCMHCPKFLACDEIAMTLALVAEPLPGGASAAPGSFPLPQRTPAFASPLPAQPVRHLHQPGASGAPPGERGH